MARYFDGKELELLAPAGTFEIFRAVAESKCDAVYVGGPNLNMRMIRKGFNLTRAELQEAVRIARHAGKKLYVTVNSLISPAELDEARSYLAFLEQIEPDALIVQDYGIVDLMREEGLTVPIHASVMMNAHNADMVSAMRDLGISRVVLSRELDLKTARLLRERTGMELEYFVHGDMCSVYGANCYSSSLLFGMSSNRGRCLKPCRWGYLAKKDGYVYPTEYPLAVKDMYMYEHLPELIDAGITSFKIEGRMRDAAFVTMLVDAYGDALDRYIDDPVGFDRQLDAKLLHDHRKRDFSTAFAFGNPGLANMNRRGEGTGQLYSTGKMFSTPTEERSMTDRRVAEVKERLAVRSSDVPAAPLKLCVRVNNIEQAFAAFEEGVDTVYAAGDVFAPDRPFTKRELLRMIERKGGTKVVLGLPRIMTDMETEQYRQLLSGDWLGLDGLLAPHIGAVRAFRHFGLPIIGDFSMNVYNERAAELYGRLGAERLTASMELHPEPFRDLIAKSGRVREVVVHGTPTVMVLELDLYENAKVLAHIGEESNAYVDDSILVLKTDKGENPVYRDQRGRNHLTTAKELCYLPFVGDFAKLGVTHFRIEGAPYATERLRSIIRAYRRALRGPEQWAAHLADLPPVFAGYTLGAFAFDREGGVQDGELVGAGRREAGH